MFIPPHITKLVEARKVIEQRASLRAVRTIQIRAENLLALEEPGVERHKKFTQLTSAVTTAGQEIDYLKQDPALEDAILLLTEEDREMILKELNQQVEQIPQD